MKIALGSDHAGYDLKSHLFGYLESAGYELIDYGTIDSTTSVDYPDFAEKVARAVSSGAVDRGILVCGTGIGISIAANKVAGIRAANCNTIEMAKLSREHNDANVLAIGGRIVTESEADGIVDVWLETEFAGGRHQKRLAKITTLETGK